jgi:CHASE3 domain sensor protein
MVRRISERVIWVGAVAVVAILVAGSLTYSRVRLLSDATGWISRTEQVRYTLQRILGTLRDAESSVRGYLITREDPFLAPHIGVRAAVETDLRSLTSLLAEDPAQQARARELERLARARLDGLDQTVTSLRAGTFVMPKPPLASGESKKTMDAFQALVAAMQSEADSRLEARLTLCDLEAPDHRRDGRPARATAREAGRGPELRFLSGDASLRRRHDAIFPGALRAATGVASTP